MNQKKLKQTILELIRRTSTALPADVKEVLNLGKTLEAEKSRAAFAVDLILKNIDMAQNTSHPVCQDTGYLSFYLRLPKGSDVRAIQSCIEASVAQATELGYLRQNSVNSLTGRNSGNNLGLGTPYFDVSYHDEPTLDIRLIQKGGGCENMTAQYALPLQIMDRYYNRDLEGVRTCILDAVNKAQGKGCSPGFLGVCIGGDRAAGLAFAKKQLLRELGDTNPVPELAELEARILQEANQLEIGPIGFGGKQTLGACKIGHLNRLPASYFVSVAYMCWAFRRRGVVLGPDMRVVEWLYQTPGEFEPFPKSEAKMRPRLLPRFFRDHRVPEKGAKTPGGARNDIRNFSAQPVWDSHVESDKAIRLQTPLSHDQIKALHAGDVILLSGTIFTGRDAVHQYLHNGGKLDVIHGGILYHCGPVIKKGENGYEVLAAGPTTSIREEPYQADVIEKFDLKAVIGKGGMGPKTLAACKTHGAVYLHAIGGAAQIYARCVKAVKSVHLEHLGSPEAVWELEVEDFPVIVTMDSHGRSFHHERQQLSDKRLKALLS